MSAENTLGDMVKRGRFSLWPCHCTLQGGARLEVCVPDIPPPTPSLCLLFPTTTTAVSRASAVSHTQCVVELVRNESQSNIYHALSPPCSTPGVLQVSLCSSDSSGSLTKLHSTQFVYTLQDHCSVVEIVVRHVREGMSLQSDLVPSLQAPEVMSELDQVLTVAVQSLDRRVLVMEDSGGSNKNTRAPRSTLFHLAAHHNLILLARHLVTLPQAILSLSLRDEQDLTPVDISRDTGNKRLLKVLTSVLLQSSTVPSSVVDQTNGRPEIDHSTSPTKRNSQDDLLRFREINEEWRDQIRRHKTSSSSMGSSNFNPEATTTSSNQRDRHSTPQPPTSSSISTTTTASAKLTHRRKSIAVMERNQLVVSGCLQIRTKDPELARSERSRKQSWSVVVGEADCRSVDTGLNELERVIGTERVKQCVTASPQGQEREGGVANYLDPTHLNLLSCYSVSCPLLTDDDESGTNSIMTSTRTSPGPDYASDSSPPPRLPLPPSLVTSISVPEDLSETGIHLHLQRAAADPHTSSSLSPSPSPVAGISTAVATVNVPQVITTRYSTEDLHRNLTAGNKRGSGGDCCIGTMEEEEEGGPRILKSGVTSRDDRGREEIDEEEDGELCKSISAPHLGTGSDEDEERHAKTSEAGKVQPLTTSPGDCSFKQKSPVQEISTGKKVMFNRSRDTLNSPLSSSHETVGKTESNPAGARKSRKKSHRRSQSLSFVELGLPQAPTGSSAGVARTDRDNGRSRNMKRNRGSATLKPTRSPLAESAQSSDQHSSASASRSNSIKDNRSRASSLLTDASSLHESEDSMSEEDDTMPDLSGLSCASLDEPSATSATPLVNEAEQDHLRPSSHDTPDGGRLGDVVLRVRNGHSRVSQELRYSADILSSYKDELEADPALSSSASRRLNSESIDKRHNVSRRDYHGEQSADDEGGPSGKERVGNDCVFEHDAGVFSDGGLSQEKTLPALSSSYRETKRRMERSPLLGRRPHTVRESTPPTPKNKLVRGLTKEEVTPVVGKMKSILGNSVASGDEALSNEQPCPEDSATSPGGGSTSLDRIPRAPITTKSNGATPSSSAHQTSTVPHASPTSPPTYPHSPSRQISSPPAVSFNSSLSSNDQGPIPKSSSDKALGSSQPLPPKKSKGKSLSLDGSSSVMKDMLSMRNAVAEPLPEEAPEEEEERHGKKDTSKVKMIRDNIIRRSKSRMKAFTILGGGPEVEKAISESYSKGSGGTGAVRAKSAKQRPKLNDIFIPPEPSNGSPHHQPAGERAEEQELPKSPKKKASRKKFGPEHRRDSDSSLIHSPTNTELDPSLSVVDETALKGVESPDPNSLSPAPPENLSDSDREEVSQQLVRSMSQSHPELEVREDTDWQRTVDRRLLRKMNKHERDRQNIIHELIQTERHHYRALHVLKLVFKTQMEKHLSEESLAIMFPQLDNLIEISRCFLDRLEERRGKEGTNIIVQDISDILLDQFTAEKREQILNTFGEFCTYHLIATEMYKEQLKKKHFGRLVQHLYRVKECQRLYLPDYYTSVSQRLTKMVQFLARLVKKTDLLKLDHAERLRQCQQELESLVAAVDQRVNERKNQMELEQIQEKLEIGLPRTAAKHPVLRAMGDLNLTAQNRRLIKRGEAQLIHGHGKQLPVHIVLVTDLVVLLTERDQKYNLPAILDLKPPIIRLYDLHVRVNASVRSGVQLLVIEKGITPEMFRLDFKSKKEAKEWEVTLTEAADVCKDNGIKCEYFGSEPMVVEDGKLMEEERGSPSLSNVRRSESQRSASSTNTSSQTLQSPIIKRTESARATLDSTAKVLSMFVFSSTNTMESGSSPRHPRANITNTAASTIAQRSPKNRHHTIHNQMKPGEQGTTTLPDRDGFLPGSEVDGTAGKKEKLQKSKIKRKGLDRSSTFKGRAEDKKERGGGDVVDTVATQQLLACTMRLRDSLEDVLRDNDEKEAEIERLKRELEKAREAAIPAEPAVVVVPRNKVSPKNSPPSFRPHSCHIDIADISSAAEREGRAELLSCSSHQPGT